MAKTRIGIPRALLYYHYYPMWKTFFEALGAEVVLSSKTTKGILDQGVKSSVDEACLPVKLYLGHILDLRNKVDYIFAPRLVSVEKRAYICPKFLGLPDMVQHTLKDLPPLIDVTVNMSRKEKQLFEAAREAAKPLTANPLKVWFALEKSLKELDKFQKLMEDGLLPTEALEFMEGSTDKPKLEPGNLNIALVGHPYNIYDSYLSMNLVNKLRSMGVNVVSPENMSRELVTYHAGRLPKKLFWSLGKKMLGSALHFMEQKDIDGIIHVAAFGCGPDSFTGELIERFIRRKKGTPFLSLTLDEHTGEAGVVTRLEAFIDMINWRASHESNLSAHG